MYQSYMNKRMTNEYKCFKINRIRCSFAEMPGIQYNFIFGVYVCTQCVCFILYDPVPINIIDLIEKKEFYNNFQIGGGRVLVFYL